jgi:transposase
LLPRLAGDVYAPIFVVPGARSCSPNRAFVRRLDAEPGFKVLPHRWVVERTFGWMTRFRRLVRDYERRIDVSEAMIYVALGSILLRRLHA